MLSYFLGFSSIWVIFLQFLLCPKMLWYFLRYLFRFSFYMFSHFSIVQYMVYFLIFSLGPKYFWYYLFHVLRISDFTRPRSFKVFQYLVYFLNFFDVLILYGIFCFMYVYLLVVLQVLVFSGIFQTRGVGWYFLVVSALCISICVLQILTSYSIFWQLGYFWCFLLCPNILCFLHFYSFVLLALTVSSMFLYSGYCLVFFVNVLICSDLSYVMYFHFQFLHVFIFPCKFKQLGYVLVFSSMS